MSTPQLKIAPLSIPPLFELDYHTRQFFVPIDRIGPVDARFKINHSSLASKVFVGRAALFCSGRLHLVMREEGLRSAPTLVSASPLPRQPADHTLWDAHIASYFETHLTQEGDEGDDEDAVGGDKIEDQEFIPTLVGTAAGHGVMRLHYESRTGIGVALYGDGGASIIDLRRKPQGVRPYRLPMSCAGNFFGETAPEDAMKPFVEMDNGAFHEGVAARLGDPVSPLARALGFARLSDHGRARLAFGCSFAALEHGLELLRLALIVELGAGGALAPWECASWQPFAGNSEGGLLAESATGDLQMIGVPPALQERFDLIGSKVGWRWTHYEEMGSDERPLWDEVPVMREWKAKWQIKSLRPSAHEAVEAAVRFKEMLG